MTKFEKYLEERNIPINSLEANSIREGIEWAYEHPKGGMVSLDEACNLLSAMLTTQDINDYDYVTAPAFDTVEDFVNDFRKSMEK